MILSILNRKDYEAAQPIPVLDYNIVARYYISINQPKEAAEILKSKKIPKDFDVSAEDVYDSIKEFYRQT